MAAITVTATQGGATFNGMGLLVKVLTGAKPVSGQTGATAHAEAANPDQVSVTTTTTGSYVYQGLSMGQTPGGPTANSTSLLSYTDATHGEWYAAYRTTSATGTPGATTVGDTGTGEVFDNIAAAEILAATTIVEDASSPAGLGTDTATTITSASFNPPAGSLLVAIIGSDGAANGSTLTTMTVTDSSGLTWTPLIQSNSTGTCYAGVWIADVPGDSANDRRYSIVAPGWIPSRTIPGNPLSTPFYVSSTDVQTTQQVSQGFNETGQGTDTLSVQIITNADFPVLQYGPGWFPGSPGSPLDTPFYNSPADNQPPLNINLSETGAGSDALTIASNVGLSETGVGTDALSVTSTVALTEAGIGTDALAVTSSVGLTETGQGTDSLSVQIVTVADFPVQQYGPGWIPGVPGMPLGTPFYVPPGDAQGQVGTPIPLTETGAGTEALSIAADVGLADGGSGTDALTIASSIGLTESGAGSDAITVASSIGFAESGQGVDSLTVNIFTVADYPTAQYGPGWLPGLPGNPLNTPFYITPGDAETQAGTPIPLAETGAGSEALSVASSVGLSDTGQGADALTIASSTGLTETGTGTDTLSVAADVGFAETGSGTDSLAVSIITVADYPVTQHAPGWFPGMPGMPLGTPFYSPPADNQPSFVPTVPVFFTESGTGTDAFGIVGVDVGLTETGAAADAITVVSAVGFTEAGAGTDALTLVSSVGFTETGAGTDTLSVSIISTPYAADYPTAQYAPGWRPGLPGMPLGIPFYNPQPAVPAVTGNFPGSVLVKNAIASPVVITKTVQSVSISNKKVSTVSTTSAPLSTVTITNSLVSPIIVENS